MVQGVSSLPSSLAVWMDLLQERQQMMVLESGRPVTGIEEFGIQKSVLGGTRAILFDRMLSRSLSHLLNSTNLKSRAQKWVNSHSKMFVPIGSGDVWLVAVKRKFGRCSTLGRLKPQ